MTIGSVTLTQRGTSASDTTPFIYTNANGTHLPPTATGIFTDNAGKLDVKLTGSLKSALSDATHTFDLTVTGLQNN